MPTLARGLLSIRIRQGASRGQPCSARISGALHDTRLPTLVAVPVSKLSYRVREHRSLEKRRQHFGMKSEEANLRASRQSLPVPVFRLGSQKSPWLVSADLLAAYIDGQREEATKQWHKLQKAS